METVTITAEQLQNAKLFFSIVKLLPTDLQELVANRAFDYPKDVVAPRDRREAGFKAAIKKGEAAFQIAVKHLEARAMPS